VSPEEGKSQGELERRVGAIRGVQQVWAGQPLREQLLVIRRLRSLLVAQDERLAAECAEARGVDEAEVYASELLPMADACRFLERRAADVLRDRRPRRGDRPSWLFGMTARVLREPYGIVLILAPSNYPLFLAGSQAIQALAAGNAVVVKPAPDCEPPLLSLAELLSRAGLPDDLFTVIPPDPEPVGEWIARAADKVLLTGGVHTGRTILHHCADALVPATMELSGVDSFHVFPDADLDRVVAALQFGLRLNRGRTCIAPRRIFAQGSTADELRRRLRELPVPRDRVPLTAGTKEELEEVLGAGAEILAGAWRAGDDEMAVPLILDDVPSSSSFWREDHFAPVASFSGVTDEEEALAEDSQCPFALGASIFSRDVEQARKLGRKLPARVVTINDTIVPTADPRVPFGGARRSGFGVTRGAEGLLELTVPKVVLDRPADSWTPHLQPPSPRDGERLQALLRAVHGSSWWDRARQVLRLAALRRNGTEEES